MPDPDSARDVAGRWLEMAGSDLEASRVLLATDHIGAELAGFHAQQARGSSHRRAPAHRFYEALHRIEQQTYEGLVSLYADS